MLDREELAPKTFSTSRYTFCGAKLNRCCLEHGVALLRERDLAYSGDCISLIRVGPINFVEIVEPEPKCDR